MNIFQTIKKLFNSNHIQAESIMSKMEESTTTIIPLDDDNNQKLFDKIKRSFETEFNKWTGVTCSAQCGFTLTHTNGTTLSFVYTVEHCDVYINSVGPLLPGEKSHQLYEHYLSQKKKIKEKVQQDDMQKVYKVWDVDKQDVHEQLVKYWYDDSKIHIAQNCQNCQIKESEETTRIKGMLGMIGQLESRKHNPEYPEAVDYYFKIRDKI
jgi:hypothetical protein